MYQATMVMSFQWVHDCRKIVLLLSACVLLRCQKVRTRARALHRIEELVMTQNMPKLKKPNEHGQCLVFCWKSCCNQI